MFYKIGQKVRIRSGTPIGDNHNGVTFVRGMEIWYGQIRTIKEYEGTRYYRLVGTPYGWADQWLAPLCESEEIE